MLIDWIPYTRCYEPYWQIVNIYKEKFTDMLHLTHGSCQSLITAEPSEGPPRVCALLNVNTVTFGLSWAALLILPNEVGGK